MLGLSGLLPQKICAAIIMSGSEWRWVALACGWAYAAVIFSFLGGIWWAQAMMRDARSGPVYLVAVVPSLIAFASFVPWTLGWPWPGPSLALLGICLAASPLVDRWIGGSIPVPDGWMRLRVLLSVGLGALTLLLAIMA